MNLMKPKQFLANSFLKDFQLIFQIDNHLFSYQSSITSAGQAVYGQRLGHKLLDVLFQCVGIFCEEMVGKGYEMLIHFVSFCSTSILEFLHLLIEPTLASNSAFAIFTFRWVCRGVVASMRFAVFMIPCGRPGMS